jgi:Inhibitor of vertebrate lysozyme (Ivy)
MLKRFAYVAALAATLSSGAFAAQGDYLFNTLKKPVWRKAWNAMLAGEKNVPKWVGVFTRTLNGTANPSDIVDINGESYELAMVCKPHDCGGNELYVLFQIDGGKAWGLLTETDKPARFLGNPDEAKKTALRNSLQQ